MKTNTCLNELSKKKNAFQNITIKCKQKWMQNRVLESQSLFFLFILERPNHEKPWGFVTVSVDMQRQFTD